MGRYASREYRYNGQAADLYSTVKNKQQKINHSVDRKIALTDFYENLGNIIYTVLESRLIKKCYADLNAETLKNVVLRRINKINEIER